LRESQEATDGELHVTTTTSTLSLIGYRVSRTERNGGYFKHKFQTYDFLLHAFVRFNDIGFRKFDRYKQVRDDCVKCVTFVHACLRILHGTVRSNKTNAAVWYEFLIKSNQNQIY